MVQQVQRHWIIVFIHGLKADRRAGVNLETPVLYTLVLHSMTFIMHLKHR